MMPSVAVTSISAPSVGDLVQSPEWDAIARVDVRVQDFRLIERLRLAGHW